MKLLLEDIRKNVDVLLEKLESGPELILTREGESVVIQELSQPLSRGQLPDLTGFRNTLNLQGEPLSQTLAELRKDYRY